MENASLDSQINATKSTMNAKQQEIESNPMYKRLDAFGTNLATTGDIMQFKDFSPTWHEILDDFRKSLPKNITVIGNSYAEGSHQVNITLRSPDRKRLVETMSLVSDLGVFINIDFDAISAEKVSFDKTDKLQYTGYSVLLKAYVSPDYLQKKYDQAQELREIKKQESSSEASQETERAESDAASDENATGTGSAESTGSVSQDTSSGAISTEAASSSGSTKKTDAIQKIRKNG